MFDPDAYDPDQHPPTMQEPATTGAVIRLVRMELGGTLTALLAWRANPRRGIDQLLEDDAVQPTNSPQTTVIR